MFIFRRFTAKRFFYAFAILCFLAIAGGVVIGGLNLTAQRMAEIVPGLPKQVISAQVEKNQLSVEILGNRLQVQLPEKMFPGYSE